MSAFAQRVANMRQLGPPVNGMRISRQWWPCCVGLPPEDEPPIEYQSQTRTGENHFGVRFGDYGGRLRVLLDGEDVTDLCKEALAGEAGWVEVQQVDEAGTFLFHPSPCHHADGCGCDDHPAMEIRHGRVAVESAPSASGAQR